jgi:hypothetical protein
MFPAIWAIWAIWASFMSIWASFMSIWASFMSILSCQSEPLSCQSEPLSCQSEPLSCQSEQSEQSLVKVWHHQLPMVPFFFPVFPGGYNIWKSFWFPMVTTDHVSNYLKMSPTLWTCFKLQRPSLSCLIGFCGGATCNPMHRLHYNGLCSSQLDKQYDKRPFGRSLFHMTNTSLLFCKTYTRKMGGTWVRPFSVLSLIPFSRFNLHLSPEAQ